MAEHETPIETVNPADLLIPANDSPFMIPTVDNDSWMDFDQNDGNWTSTPIYAGEQVAGGYLQPPQSDRQQLPATGTENLMWMGELSYSSYGSSIPDGMGMSHLVRRFGEHNICLSPTDTFARSVMSRDAPYITTTSSPQPDFSPTCPRPQRRRGRLLADMSPNGPETVFEDSDSHHSWTAADNAEDWCAILRERLLDFRRHKDRIAIITSKLQTRQRRKVHSMANLWGLSHMSIGAGREKRMLICKAELSKSPTDSSSKRWSPNRTHWSLGLVDPRVVLLDYLCPAVTPESLRQHLIEAGLPLPLQLIISAQTTAYALFETPNDAATVILTLDGTRPPWNHATDVECDYIHFPPSLLPTEDLLLTSFENLPILLATTLALPPAAKRPSSATFFSDSSDSETHHITRTPPNHRDSGYISSGNPSDTSITNSSRKRKRVPKILGGYPCGYPDCSRVFDRDGDRRKHEKNHSAKRTHVCSECGKGFLFPKDLRRHMIVHNEGITTGGESSAAESSIAESGQAVGSLRVFLYPASEGVS